MATSRTRTSRYFLISVIIDRQISLVDFFHYDPEMAGMGVTVSNSGAIECI